MQTAGKTTSKSLFYETQPFCESETKEVKKKKQFKEGDMLVYTGKGFLSFDPSDKTMTFIRPCVNSFSDIWVEYKGMELTVRDSEVEKKKRKKTKL